MPHASIATMDGMTGHRAAGAKEGKEEEAEEEEAEDDINLSAAGFPAWIMTSKVVFREGEAKMAIR